MGTRKKRTISPSKALLCPDIKFAVSELVIAKMMVGNRTTKE
jgi:hypothetical protein